MANTPPSMPSRRKQLTRDQRIKIISLHNYGVNQVSIARELQVTRSQVRYTLSKKDFPSPSKRSGRPLVMTEDQIDELEGFCVNISVLRVAIWKHSVSRDITSAKP